MSDEATAWGGQLWAVADLVTPMTVRVAATLRLADHIAAGRNTVEALAVAVDADPDALGRVMAHLVTAGVLTCTGHTFGLTEWQLAFHTIAEQEHTGAIKVAIDPSR